MGFCQYCGRQLAEGEVCNCSAQAAPTMQQPQFNQQQFNQQQFNQQQLNQQINQQANQAIGALVMLVKGIFTKPADAVKAYVQRGDMILPAALIAILAFISGLETMIYRLIYNVKYFDSYSGGKIVAGFFVEFIRVIGIAAVLAALLMVMINVLEKDKKVSFAQTLSITSLLHLVTIPVSFVASLIGEIPARLFSMISSWMGSFASAYALILVFLALRSVTKDENHMPLSYAVAAVSSAVVSSIIFLLM